MTSLHNKYRPTTLDEIRGQKATCTALKQVIRDKSNQAFCFVGPSGTGKTTLARIIANMVGKGSANVVEIDAASHSGVDKMRELARSVIYNPIGESEATVVVVDEAHALSKAAWQALLKPLEEPGAHVYWVLLTTEAEKIPKTIRTRCAWFELTPVPDPEMLKLVKQVAQQEEIKLKKDVAALVADSAEGSPRQALTILAKVHGMSYEDAETAITGITSMDDSIAFVRSLSNPTLKWRSCMRILAASGVKDFESLRYKILGYYAVVASKADDPIPALRVMEAFRDQLPPGNNGKPLFLLALGELIYE